MRSTVLSSKGQVIIPKALRVARLWGPGTRLEVHDTLEGVLLRPVEPTKKTALADGLAAIRKRVAYRGPVVSLAQMDAAVLREAARLAPTHPLHQLGRHVEQHQPRRREAQQQPAGMLEADVEGDRHVGA